jgi:hypothetical protein
MIQPAAQCSTALCIFPARDPDPYTLYGFMTIIVERQSKEYHQGHLCMHSLSTQGVDMVRMMLQAHSRLQTTKHMHKTSTYDLNYLNTSAPSSEAVTPRSPVKKSEDHIVTGDAGGRRTAPVFRNGALEAAATSQETEGSGNGQPHGLIGTTLTAIDPPLAMGENGDGWGRSSKPAYLKRHSGQLSVQYTPSALQQLEMLATRAYNLQPRSVAVH